MNEPAINNLSRLEVKHSQGRVIAKVIEPSIEKQERTDMGGSKQAVDTDPFEVLIRSRLVIEPPFDPFTLYMITERNSELRPCIEVMEKNIEGFGSRIISVVNLDADDAPPGVSEKVRAEFTRLVNFFMYAGMEESFQSLRMKTRHDLEATGNAYWEVVRNAAGDITYFEQIKAYQVRLTAQERIPFEFRMPLSEVQPDGSVKIVEVKRRKRFRRYAQVASISPASLTSSGYETRWFKEFGDPRVYDNTDGRLVSDAELASFPEERKSNEVIHFKLFSGRSPYGIPRYIGSLIDILGDRKASEINYTTFCNNTIPSLVISVSNGELTEGTINRIKEFLDKLQGNDNRAMVLVVEAEAVGEEGEQTGQVKIDVKPLTNDQINDALFQKYQEYNREKVRVSYRIPPIFIGRSLDYTRATADTSRRLADEQVFAPERDYFDDWINRILFPSMGVVYHRFKSNSPNTTDNTELVQILSGAEKTGGMTPRRADIVLRDILGRDLPDFAEDERFNIDLPFSLSMAEAVKNQADPTQPGQQVTAMKLRTVTGMANGVPGIVETINDLIKLRQELDSAWMQGTSSESKGDNEPSGL